MTSRTITDYSRATSKYDYGFSWAISRAIYNRATSKVRLQITVERLPSTITDSVWRFQERFTVERLPKYDYGLQSSDFQVRLRIQLGDSKNDLQSSDFQATITDLQSNGFQERSDCIKMIYRWANLLIKRFENVGQRRWWELNHEIQLSWCNWRQCAIFRCSVEQASMFIFIYNMDRDLYHCLVYPMRIFI